MKMYNYKFGYYSCEESEYFELSHEKKFSKEELTEIIAEICKGLINFEERNFGFQYLIESVREELINKYGFKEIGYEVKWDVFGWADLLDEKDWEESTNDTLKDLRKRLKVYNEKTSKD